MQEVVRGKIRKITCGPNPVNARAFKVGPKPPGQRWDIVKIIHDKNYPKNNDGNEKFLVVCRDDKGLEFVWNDVIGIAVVVEYFAPDGEPVNYI